MSWKSLLSRELKSKRNTCLHLIGKLDESDLGWKPDSGSNWMTVAQLLNHLATANAFVFKGFHTGDWGMPIEEIKNMPKEEMLPPAEKMPAVNTISEAVEMLNKDTGDALATLETIEEEELAEKQTEAPWMNNTMILGHRLLTMVEHQNNHLVQLFLYLKLMGKPVNTEDLYKSLHD